MGNWLNASVIDNRRLTDEITSLIIGATLPGFQSGQFVRIGLVQDDEVLARPYSLVNTPDENFLEVYLNIVRDGPLSPLLFNLKPGDDVLVYQNPSGFLTLGEVPTCRHLWMVATGTGVGPFLSILKGNEVWQRFEKIVLCYSISHANELGYRNLIEKTSQCHRDQFRFVAIVTREPVANTLNERIPLAIDNGSLENKAGIMLDAKDSHVMMCGNSAMIGDVSEALMRRGMKKHRRRTPGQFSSEKYY